MTEKVDPATVPTTPGIPVPAGGYELADLEKGLEKAQDIKDPTKRDAAIAKVLKDSNQIKFDPSSVQAAAVEPEAAADQPAGDASKKEG
jgi:hypothetical protein